MALTVYTAGEVLTASSLNANLTFAAANPPATPGGLELISTTTIGTTVASVTVSGAFSATFDAYKIIITGGLSSANPTSLLMQLGATTTGYYWAQNGRTFGDVDSSGAGSNQSSWRFGGGSSKILASNIDIVGPFLSNETYFSGEYLFATTTGLVQNVAGFLDNTTSYTAFTITCSSGTITGGEIRVYGYKN